MVTEEKGTIVGCLTFKGSAVTRDATVTYSAKLTLPAACTFMQPCSTVETYLKMAFPTASCMTGSNPGSCVCTVSTQSQQVATTTYTTTNNQIVTSTNNKYDYCVQGNMMGLHWAAGPNQEVGVYGLTKQ
jgi:hypothetical protein